MTSDRVDAALAEFIRWGKHGTDREMMAAALAAAVTTVPPLQQRVQPWLMACFGPEIAADREERNHRFLEEALELVQACGATAGEAHQLVDYVFGRPAGSPDQEAGGVMITLAALCLANGLDMHGAGERELDRIWTKVVQIRAKQAAKPKHSPLPEAPSPAPPAGTEGRPDQPAPEETLDEEVARLQKEHLAGALADATRKYIAKLQDRIRELENALRPFAKAADNYDRSEGGYPLPEGQRILPSTSVTIRDLRRARALIGGGHE